MAASQPNIPHADCLQYPYKRPQNIVPEYDDIYERPVASLVASFARFGKRVMKKTTDPEDMENLDMELIESIVRMCEDSMEPDDFDVLIRRAPTLPGSRIIRRGSKLIDSLQESQRCEQVIVPHSVSQDKWLIYLVTLSTGNIDIYVIGEMMFDEAEPFHGQLLQALSTVFPKTIFSPRQRLHLRARMYNDPVLAAYLLSWYLHFHGKYLDLNEEKINRHKFKVFEQFMDNHDRYLGEFMMKKDIKSTHPFVVGKAEEKLPTLESLGWCVIDVDGDGHCGFYSIILGLENLGIKKYSCKGKHRPSAQKMCSNIPWKQKILRFRQLLRKHSEKMLENINAGTKDEPEWWQWIYIPKGKEAEGIPDPKQSLSKAFFDPNFRNWWPNGKLDDRYQLEPLWGCIVAASKLGLRIIVIFLESHVSESESKGASEDFVESNANWSTHFFDCLNRFGSKEPESECPHLSHTIKDGVHRISDRDFNSKPTIELLLYQGWLNHFLWLRRVLVTNTPILKSSNVSIRTSLQLAETCDTNLSAPNDDPLAPAKETAQPTNELTQTTNLSVPNDDSLAVTTNNATQNTQPTNELTQTTNLSVPNDDSLAVTTNNATQTTQPTNELTQTTNLSVPNDDSLAVTTNNATQAAKPTNESTQTTNLSVPNDSTGMIHQLFQTRF